MTETKGSVDEMDRQRLYYIDQFPIYFVCGNTLKIKIKPILKTVCKQVSVYLKIELHLFQQYSVKVAYFLRDRPEHINSHSNYTRPLISLHICNHQHSQNLTKPHLAWAVNSKSLIWYVANREICRFEPCS